MPQPSSCRLCRNISNDSLRLYDANGHYSEIYEITIKFFHPMFLNMEHGVSKLLAAVCVKCWHHISTFNNFQQTVLLLQSQLRRDGEHAKIIAPNIRENSIEEFPRVPSNNVSANSTQQFSLTPNNGISTQDIQQSPMVPYNDAQESLLVPYNTSSSSINDAVQSLTVPQQTEMSFNLNQESLIEPSHDINMDVEEEFVSLSEVELVNNTRQENQLLIAKHEIVFNPEVNLENEENTQGTISSQGESNEIEEEEPLDSITIKEEPVDDGNETFSEMEATESHVSSDSESRQETTRRSTRSGGKRKENTEADLDAEIAQWKPTLECNVCNATCDTLTLLQRHFIEKHPTTEFYITCCKEKFEIRRDFEEHVRLHMDPEAFQCEICRKCCSSQSDLEHHIANVHPSSLERLSKRRKVRPTCTKCDKSFASPSALRQHLPTHTGEQERKCLYCTRSFKYRSSLHYHMNAAHPEKTVKNKKP